MSPLYLAMSGESDMLSDKHGCNMQLIVNIPDDLIAQYRHVLPPPAMGLLETVALDAILGLLTRLAEAEQGRPDAPRS